MTETEELAALRENQAAWAASALKHAKLRSDMRRLVADISTGNLPPLTICRRLRDMLGEVS